MESLRQEIKKWSDAVKSDSQNLRIVDTVYFGGGTPNLLGVKKIAEVLNLIKMDFTLADDVEITLEVNPTKFGKIDFARLKEAGVNRLSVGMQSANDKELKLLGRTHNKQATEYTVKDAQRAGFENISLDLMVCTPGQTKASLLKSIDFCEKLKIQHISAYLLKLEKGTEYYLNKDKLDLKDENTQSEIYLFVCEELEKRGFHQYEISNFSTPNSQSKHNLKYWNAEEYIGIGPSAHSFLNGKRFFYANSLNEFINNPKTIDDGLGGDIKEYAMLQLRLSDGLRNTRFYEKFGVNIPQRYFHRAKLYEKYNLVKVSKDGFHLTKKGNLVSNSLIYKIIYDE